MERELNHQTAGAEKLVKEDINTIRKSALFAGIGEDGLLSILSCLGARKRVYKKGMWILQAGDRITSVGLILSGSAHIERYDYWGGRHIVNAVLPGDLFCESYAASSDNTVNVSVRADENVCVLFVEIAKILHMCSSACPFHAQLIDNLVSLLARRNLFLNEKLTYVTQHTLRDKILSYLSAESIRQHASDFDIPCDRQQLADYLNAERSALSNELSKMKHEGIIDYQKNHFHLNIPAGTSL